MKKLLVLVMSIILGLSMFSLIGCGNKEGESVSFDNVPIGYQLAVYPDCEFDYKVSDECIVHVNEIKIELTQKNTIGKNDLLSAPYYPYVFHVSATGTTDPKFANQKIYLELSIDETYKQLYERQS